MNAARRAGARAAAVTAAAALGLGLSALTSSSAASPKVTDPLCAANYDHGPISPARRLRFGVDPEPAGSVGRTQGQVKPVNASRALHALVALRPRDKALVLRINRLFEADGEAGIRHFKRIIDRYTRRGFATELQVRYHPSAAQAGNIAAWTRYVRHVVDALGPNRHLIAMTITNEINLALSPNTSDGAYPRAEDALIQGIIAAHREALRRGFRQLRFGFTFAYRFDPRTDAAVFTGLRRGGSAFRRALGFVGVDYYPELYPGVAIGLRPATLRMLASVRRCFMALGGLGARVPIWITESGYDTAPGEVSEARQASALVQIVNAIKAAAATYGVTDYRWFNLRDNVSSAGGFAETSGLLTDTYRRKPAFSAYRRLIARFGAAAPAATPPRG